VLLVDARGTLVRRIEGGEIDDPGVLSGAIEALLGETFDEKPLGS
jgi:hypothetical protein